MPWWKKGIYVSLGWLSVVILFSAVLVWLIAANPQGEAVDELRMNKAGNASGQLLGIGLGGIWAYLYLRERKRISKETDGR